MDRSNSGEIAKWPEWSAVIGAVWKASVKVTTCRVAVIQLHYLQTGFPVLLSVSLQSSSSSLFDRLCHHQAPPGWGDPLQGADTGTGTDSAVDSQNFTGKKTIKKIKRTRPWCVIDVITSQLCGNVYMNKAVGVWDILYILVVVRSFMNDLEISCLHVFTCKGGNSSFVIFDTMRDIFATLLIVAHIRWHYYTISQN